MNWWGGGNAIDVLCQDGLVVFLNALDHSIFKHITLCELHFFFPKHAAV